MNAERVDGCIAWTRSEGSFGRRARVLSWVALLSVSTQMLPAEVSAQDPPLGTEALRTLPTTVRVIATMEPGCGLRAALLERLSTELRTDGVERVLEGPADLDGTSSEDTSVARIEVSGLCAQTLHVRIEDRATEKRVERDVPLQDVAVDARARVAALAVTGLLRASWAELVWVDAPGAPESIREGAVRRTRDALALADDGPESGERLDPPADRLGSAGEAGESTEPGEPRREQEANDGVVEGGGSERGDGALGERIGRARVDGAREDGEGAGSRQADASEDPPSQSASLSLGGSVSGRLFFSETTLIGGLHVWLGIKAIRVGLAAFGGYASAPAGRALEWVSSVEFEGRLLRLDRPRVAFDIALRGSLGLARVRGLPVAGAVGSVANDVTLGAEILARLSIPLSRVTVELTASLGAMLGPTATADGAAIASLGGTMTSLGLGVSRVVRR